MPKLGATLSRVGGASVALVAAAAEADGATAVDAEGVPVLDGSALSAPQRRRSLGSPPRLQFARALSGDAMPTRKPPLPMSPDSLCASPESADESAKPAARCGAPSPCEASSQGEAPAPLRSGAWLIVREGEEASTPHEDAAGAATGRASSHLDKAAPTLRGMADGGGVDLARGGRAGPPEDVEHVHATVAGAAPEGALAALSATEAAVRQALDVATKRVLLRLVVEPRAPPSRTAARSSRVGDPA